jgi:hypothetical protein
MNEIEQNDRGLGIMSDQAIRLYFIKSLSKHSRFSGYNP